MYKLEFCTILNTSLDHAVFLFITGCTCDPVGSISDFCEPSNGTCECLPNVSGSNCSTCEPNYWGLSDGVGCVPCLCNEIGIFAFTRSLPYYLTSFLLLNH